MELEEQTTKFSGKQVTGTLTPDEWHGDLPVILDGYVAPSYGIKLPAPIVQYQWKTYAPVKVRFRISAKQR